MTMLPRKIAKAMAMRPAFACATSLAASASAAQKAFTRQYLQPLRRRSWEEDVFEVEVYARRHQQNAVEAIECAAMAGDQCGRVFDARVALHEGLGEVGHVAYGPDG